MVRQAQRTWSAGRLPVLLLHDAAPVDDPGGGHREATVDGVDEACRQFATEGVRYLTVDQCPPSALRYHPLQRSGPDGAQRPEG
jgi:hypothetical protein